MSDRSSEVMLLTGATNGIGEAAAHALARTGARLVLVGRDAAKAERVRAAVSSASGNPNIDTLIADLSSQAAIRQLAATFKAKYNRLDVLLNNAGGVFDTRRETVDGIEYTFALNHLGYFLLTNLLLDIMKTSAPARIVNVSSAAQGSGRMPFDDIENRRSYNAFGVYAQSKLANVMFTYALDRRLTGSNVMVNALHPGFVNSGFGSNSSNALVRGVFSLIKLAAITPEQGADTAVYLASDPAVANVSGKYFAKRKEERTSTLSYDQAAQERLWQVSEQMTS